MGDCRVLKLPFTRLEWKRLASDGAGRFFFEQMILEKCHATIATNKG